MKESGAHISEHLDKNVDYLVAGKQPLGDKYVDAVKIGTKIIDEMQF